MTRSPVTRSLLVAARTVAGSTESIARAKDVLVHRSPTAEARKVVRVAVRIVGFVFFEPGIESFFVSSVVLAETDEVGEEFAAENHIGWVVSVDALGSGGRGRTGGWWFGLWEVLVDVMGSCVDRVVGKV